MLKLARLRSGTALKKLADNDRKYQHDADDDDAPFATDARELKAVLEQLDGDDAQNCASNCATSSKDAGATEDHGSDYVQLDPRCSVRSCGRDPGGKNQAGEPRHKAAECVDKQLRAPDVQARETRGGLIVADRVQRSSKGRPRQSDSTDDRHEGEEIQLDWQAEDFSTAKKAEPLGKSVDGA